MAALLVSSQRPPFKWKGPQIQGWTHPPVSPWELFVELSFYCHLVLCSSTSSPKYNFFFNFRCQKIKETLPISLVTSFSAFSDHDGTLAESPFLLGDILQQASNFPIAETVRFACHVHQNIHVTMSVSSKVKIVNKNRVPLFFSSFATTKDLVKARSLTGWNCQNRKQ